MNEEVLDEAGIFTEPNEQTLEKALAEEEAAPGEKELSQLEQLENELKTAIETENYEKAAKIRDRIQKMKG